MDKKKKPLTISYEGSHREHYYKGYDTTNIQGNNILQKETDIHKALNTSDAKKHAPLSAPEIYEILSLPGIGKIVNMEHLGTSIDVTQLTREEIFSLDNKIKQTMSYLDSQIYKPLNREKKELFLQYFAQRGKKIPLPNNFKTKISDQLNRKMLLATVDNFAHNIESYNQTLQEHHPDHFTIHDRLATEHQTDIHTIINKAKQYITKKPSTLSLSLSHGRSRNPHIFENHLIDFKSTGRRNEYNDHIGLLYSKLLMDAGSYSNYNAYKEAFEEYKKHIDQSPDHVWEDIKKVLITKLIGLYIDNALIVTREENHDILDTRTKHFDHNHLLLQDLLENSI